LLKKVHEGGWLQSVKTVEGNPKLVSVGVKTVTGETTTYRIYRSAPQSSSGKDGEGDR